MSDDGELRRTDYYSEILKRLDAHHVLYGVVREQGAALGQLSLYRPLDAPAFTPRERADLASVMRYVAHGIAGDDARPKDPAASFTYEDSDDEAMLVTDRGGVIRPSPEKGPGLPPPATTSAV